ncbi:ATP-binding protein [Marinovum sp. 2_MG-2023]|uniref:ATP-binding protein n=1 Tax=unclassified Marinovum TaxID=2647166 RepID=UPI0026E2C447|nr:MULTISPECIES: ATP-binding protein [unclassified Marinovum]MDO6728867.1 ATP-binding protein [Marinovum sp. 2_MG-2023]MDO6777717.1 ATP-binding protein [Marinovum sp. 1_MG-2023]
MLFPAKRFFRDLSKIESLFALAVLVTALAVLVVGWGVGTETVVRIRPEMPAMVPETAMALALAAVGTLAAVNRWPKVIPLVMAAGLLLIVLASYRTPPSLQGLGTSDAMAPATAFCLVCLACSMAGLAMKFTAGRAMAVAAGFLCALISGTAIMAQIFVSDSVRDVFGFSEMALHTAGGIFTLTLAFIASSRDSAHFRGLLGSSPKSRILRVSVLLSILAVLGFCGLTSALTVRELMTADFRLVFLGSAMISVLIGSAFVVGYLIDRLEVEEHRSAALESASSKAIQSVEINSERDENLRVLGQIVAGVAHDFNNALTALRGNLELIELDPEKAPQYVGEAISAADRAAGLTKQLLETGRKSRLNSAESDVLSVAQQVIKLFGRVAPKNISVSLHSEEDKIAGVQIDDATLERALLNLLVNSRDAMPGGGEINVEIKERHITNGYAATFNFNAGLTPGNYVVIEVTDSGSGMDDETVARAVQPYFSTKGVGKGSGLGLASVNGICQQLGGGLLINSELGKGTSIAVAMPISSARKLREQAVENGPVTAEEDSHYDILLVANETQSSSKFFGHLNHQRRKVRHTASGGEALDLLDSFKLPSVVLIDEGMFGDLSGEELKNRIQSRYSNLPVVYVGDCGTMNFATGKVGATFARKETIKRVA